MVLGLKGLVGCEIQVTGAERDLHTGMHGGGIANTIHALSLIISSMKNQDGKITIDGFYEDVIDLSVQVRNEIAKVLFNEDDYCKSVGAPESFGEMGYTILKGLSARLTLEPNGICGGYEGKGTKTVLPSEASAKITCRLVADQVPEKVYELLKSHVEANTPRGVTVKVKQLPGKANPFLVPMGHNSSEVVRSVLQKLYDKEPYKIKVGSSIPVMSTLLE